MRIPYAILTEFTGSALDLHNIAKFGWFTSINDKIIYNFIYLAVAIFSNIFNDLLPVKLQTESTKLRGAFKVR